MEIDTIQIAELFQKIENSLEQLLVGKTPAPITETVDDPLVNRIIELLNMLSGNFGEMAEFARALSCGQLNLDPPGRRNYLAAPLKELHSQLSNFVWRAQQLAKGRSVSRMDYSGELSDALNALIERVNILNSQEGHPSLADQSSESLMDCQHYHHVLAALQHLPQMIIVLDANRNLQFANQSANLFFTDGISLSGILPDAAADLPILLQTLYTHSLDENIFPIEREVCDTTTGAWYKVITDQIFVVPGTHSYLHSIEDISSWKHNETKLKETAATDSLTGVYNRGHALSTLEQSIARRADSTSCAAFIDIDRLKTINDTYGHDEGDFTIRTIAQALADSVRGSDVVSRFGGDEFVVIFQDCSIEIAEQVMHRVQEKIDSINETHGKPYRLSFSYGITQIDAASSASIKDIIQIIDKKMYERKRAKR